MSVSLKSALRRVLLFGIFTSCILIERSEAAVPQLLVNGDFTQGSTGWGPFFERAYVVDINATNEADKQNWCPSPTGGYKRYLLFKGWYENGQPAIGAYPGAGQTVLISSANLSTHGRFLTVSFNAKFDLDYKADKTVIILKHGYYDNATAEVMLDKDFTEEINANLGKFHTYKAVYLRPSNKPLGGVGLIFQCYNFQCSQSSPRTVILDKITLSQQQASDVGPQLSVKVVGLDQANNGTCELGSPIAGKSTYYALKIENHGGENLILSSITLGGTGLSLSGATPTTLAPGATQTCSIIASPSAAGLMSGVLRIRSNDKDLSDQDYVINLSTKAIDLNDNFTSGSPESLGWDIDSNNVEPSSATSVTGGSLVMNVNASTYPWSYQISKTFASPGTLNIGALSILAELKASGIYSGGTQNKVEVRLESLNGSKEFATGSLQLGQWVDETTAGSAPGAFQTSNPPGTYDMPDGKNDRVVVRLPEGGDFTQVGGSLTSTAINTTFDPYAPYFRLVVKMTDFDFDQGSNKKVELNYLNLDLATQGFNLSNGGFEEGSYSPPNTDPQYYWAGINIEGWNKYPTEGVAKAVVSNGDAVYNSTGSSESVVFSAFAGTKSMKVYGQNYYNSSGVWVGPSQTGTVYQEFLPSRTPGLTAGTVIHARGMAMMFSIDPLTGGSTFSYGFKFMDSANAEISRAVITFNSANFAVDKWLPLTVNATIPEGTQKIQLISEFIQNASTDKGAVYLDDLSIGFGSINATANVDGTTYQLAWSDEFDGTGLNTANWTPETGTGDNGWGNGEQQSYTSNSDNLRVEGGSLLIQAKKNGTSWTSARIKSQGLRSFKYGKIEFRAKLPTGIGPWPAAWMLGNNISTAGWPACGEIDVMEWRGNPTSDANTVSHALHSATRNGISGSPLEPPSRSVVDNPSGAFHTYAVVWTASNLVFSVDGEIKATLTPPSPDAAAFQKEFFLILNLAMGGNYVGNTIASSLTSASYEVDYVRVYQAASATVTSPTAPAAPTFSSVTSTGFTVNWLAVSEATSYRIDLSASSTFANYVSQDLTVSGTSQAVTGLNPGTTYYARVRAVNSGGTSSSSSNGSQATLTSFQQYLSGLGYSTSTAFNADANADGVKEGIKYAFNAATPQLGTSPATIVRSGSNLTYTFDIRNDSALSIVAELSTNLTSWTPQASSVITTTTGAAPGYSRKIVTITTTEPKAFIRLQVTGN